MIKKAEIIIELMKPEGPKTMRIDFRKQMNGKYKAYINADGTDYFPEYLDAINGLMREKLSALINDVEDIVKFHENK